MKYPYSFSTARNVGAVLTAVALTGASSHAATRTWDGSTSTAYNVDTNWSGDDVPDSNDSGVLDGEGAGVTDLTGGVTPSTANALNIRLDHLLNIDNAGGVLNVNANVNMGRGDTGVGLVAKVTHSAGAFNIGGLDMSGNPDGNATSYTLSGTAGLSVDAASSTRDFDIGGNVGDGDYDATFGIEGGSATVTLNATPVVLRSSAKMNFTLGAAGIDSIDTSGSFTLQPGAALSVDGSSYTGGNATIPLFTYGSRTDATEFTMENITGFAGHTVNVVYDADSIDLVISDASGPSASSISVNFHSNDADALVDHQLTAGESAGLTPLDGSHWNNINVGNPAAKAGATIFAPTSLVDDLGNSSAATISSTLLTGSSGSWFVGYAASSAADANELGNGISDDNLFNSYLATNSSDNFAIDVTGLGSDFTTQGYSLIIYSDSDRRNTGTNNRQSLFTITPSGGSPVTAFVEDDDGAATANIFDGTYILSDGVDDGADYSNVVVISGLNAADFTLEIDSLDGGRGAISGFQIIAGDVDLDLPPVINSFLADDQYVQAGDPVLLSWDALDADSLTLDPGNIDVTGLDQYQVNPAAATTYTLTASNSKGSVNAELQVKVGPERPNILLCLVDDWGVMDTSEPFSFDSYTDGASPVVRAFNNFYQTPNLEQLADDGMIFSQAYALPVCSPTRTSLMTGFNGPRHGVTVHLNADSAYERPSGSNVATHRSPNGWRYLGMEATDVTLPRLLSEQGYRSIHCGKAHFGARGEDTEDPREIGFDINLGGSGAGAPGRYIGNPGFSSGSNQVPNIEDYHGSGKWLTEALTEAMSDAIGDAVGDGVPFFGYMSYYAVHSPFTKHPNKSFDDYGDGVNDTHRRFATMVAGVDDSLGQLRAHLESLDPGVAENTLIIFTGDNGSDSPALNSGGQIASGTFNDYPIRGKKANCYEGGYHVPLFVAWAKEDASNVFQQQLPIAKASVEHDIVSVVDIPTTILSVADVAHPSMDGADLSPYLSSAPGTHREQTLLRHQPNSQNSSFFTAYRRDDLKLIYFYYKDPSNAFELYDLAVDRDESNNLASTHPDLVLEMAREMASALDEGWGAYGELWPTLAIDPATGNPFSSKGDDFRPLNDDPFLIDFSVYGYDLVDSDGDGLADALEDADGNGLVGSGETDSEDDNSDGDNLLDGEEVALGLDPLDSNSFFYLQGAPQADGSLTLTWPSQPGTNFEIRGSVDLIDWSEVVVPDVAASDPGSTTSENIPASAAPQKFFRIGLK